MNEVVCKQLKCKDYLTDEGEPAWCFCAGQPAEVAVDKCPIVQGNNEKGTTGGYDASRKN